MCGSGPPAPPVRRRPRPYILLGAFSSAFFLYGVALLYGYAGSVDLGDVYDATGVAGRSDTLLFLGPRDARGRPAVQGRRGAVPGRTPDVYQGAPTAVTALMAAATKVAAFGALLRVRRGLWPGRSGTGGR